MVLSVYDWVIIAFYLFMLLSLAAYLSRSQKSLKDYFLGGNRMGPVKIAISVMATQCSTNSILGAPAFVAFAAGGGLIWLQYELAVPLAMIFIMLIMFPMFLNLKIISVYEYLENRFDLKTRLLLSGLFQFIRVFATAVTVYSLAIIVELITGLSFFWSVMLLGIITVIYDTLGGIRAIVYSDVIQMGVLVTVLFGLLLYLIDMCGGVGEMFHNVSEERLKTINWRDHGFGDGQDFALWPMLFGGLFLYISYYGCDQSQVQRELCVRNQKDAQTVFFINGLARFPLVLLYCFVGLGISAYASLNPEFLSTLPTTGNGPNFNLAVPIFFIENLPVGIVGLSLVALFAAAMSSLDSVINSLSATTMEDFIKRHPKGKKWLLHREILVSRSLTAFWGILALAMSFFVDDIATTVLVAINKIGSLVNGPVLGVFMLGLLTKRSNGSGACTGLLFGFFMNIILWLYFPLISWLWWNVIGFGVTCIIGRLASAWFDSETFVIEYTWSLSKIKKLGISTNEFWRYYILLAWFGLIFFYLFGGV